ASQGDNSERYVPLYEAKMIHQYNHRYGDFLGAPEKEDTDYREIPQADATTLASPDYEPTPRYWVSEDEVMGRLQAKKWTRSWLLGWRDIARTTDERTLISGIIPAFGCGDKFLLIFPGESADRCAALYASLNSIPCDYIARQKLGSTSFKYFT